MAQSKSKVLREAGFTLTELVVTMLVVFVIVGIGVPIIDTVMSQYRLTMTAQTIMGQLQSARMKAVAGNETFRVNFPAGQNVFQLEDSSGNIISGPFTLPPGITWNTESDSGITFDSNYVSFQPTGNVPASGAGSAGRCKIVNASRNKIDLVVSNGGIIRQTPTYTGTAPY